MTATLCFSCSSPPAMLKPWSPEQDAPMQLDLFTDRAALERQEKLDLCVESIRGRFGATAIHPAILCGEMPTDEDVERGGDNSWATLNRMKQEYSSPKQNPAL